MKLIASITLILLAGACAETGTSERQIGMANPASVSCERLGGRVEIRDEAEGQVGYCHLPDGNVVEEWDLYRSQT